VDPSDASSLKVILGAGSQAWSGWTSTQQSDLDLLDRGSFERWFGARRADAFLCEHVFEHLTPTEATEAARIIFDYLRPGGWLRCAVPDANFPDADYQRLVQVGGPGPLDHPAADHKVVYEYRGFSELFESVGFEVDLLEYCDEAGRFHYHGWDVESGPIYRSLLRDHRNRAGRLGFVSLIVDARKAPCLVGPGREGR